MHRVGIANQVTNRITQVRVIIRIRLVNLLVALIEIRYKIVILRCVRFIEVRQNYSGTRNITHTFSNSIHLTYANDT